MHHASRWQGIEVSTGMRIRQLQYRRVANNSQMIKVFHLLACSLLPNGELNVELHQSMCVCMCLLRALRSTAAAFLQTEIQQMAQRDHAGRYYD